MADKYLIPTFCDLSMKIKDIFEAAEKKTSPALEFFEQFTDGKKSLLKLDKDGRVVYNGKSALVIKGKRASDKMQIPYRIKMTKEQDVIFSMLTPDLTKFLVPTFAHKVMLNWVGGDHLPNFDMCSYDEMEIRSSWIKSLKGLPESLKKIDFTGLKLKSFGSDMTLKKVDELNLWGNDEWNSLEGAPENIGTLKLSSLSNFKTFKNIHKQLKNIKVLNVSMFVPVEDSVLGLLKIESLQRITGTYVKMDNHHEFDDDDKLVIEDDVCKRFGRALFIVNEHLKERNLIECQDALIAAGLDDYAKL